MFGSYLELYPKMKEISARSWPVAQSLQIMHLFRIDGKYSGRINAGAERPVRQLLGRAAADGPLGYGQAVIPKSLKLIRLIYRLHQFYMSERSR